MIRECEASIEAEQYEQAAMNCETAYQDTGDPRAGLLAARALARLGEAEAVAEWASRLEGAAERAEIAALLGDTRFARGELRQALAAYAEELELRRAGGDPSLIGKGAYKVAFISWRLSDYLTAIEHYAVAHRRALEAGDRELAAQTMEALYALLFEIGDLEGARRALEQAEAAGDRPGASHRLAIGRGLLDLQSDRPQLAIATLENVTRQPAASRILQSAHLNLVEAYLAVGDLESAARSVEAAWELAGDVTSDRSVLYALRAKVAAAHGRLEAALEDFDRALAAAPGPHRQWEIQYERGKLQELLGRPRAAEAAYEAAIEVIDESRATVGFDDYKEWLLAKRRRPHERLFRLQVARGALDEAFATAEKIKARTFMDAFLRATSEAAGDRSQSTSSAWVARRGRDRLASLGQILPALGASPVASSRPIASVLAALRHHHVLFFLQVEEEEFWRLELVGGAARAQRLAAPAGRIATLARELSARPDDRGPAEALGEALLAGAELPRRGRLVVVTDGPLGALPLALVRWRGRYLAESHEIAYAPSLTALAAIEERAWRGAGEKALILADPVGDLPAAAAEGREIARRLGTTVHLGAQATRERLTVAPPPRLLHLATHTWLGPAGPSLQLAGGAIGAAEVLENPTDPAIVVLASCASASRRGEGLWGSMGGVFLAAGARAVVASLWSVEDRAAREFVLRFYREGALEDPLRALARAQRSLLAEGQTAERWAPFVLLGSPRALTTIETEGG